MSNNTNPIKDLLGPLYEVAVATGEWLGNQLDNHTAASKIAPICSTWARWVLFRYLGSMLYLRRGYDNKADVDNNGQ